MRIFFSNCIILIASLLALFGCDIQKNMLYYPSTYMPSQASLATYNIQFWPADSNGYRGFINIVHADKIKGTILIFHGNAGTAADRLYYVQVLTMLGYRVILAEYPGYGGRKGVLGEESFVHDAKETLLLASKQYGTPIFLLGESLGCGVVAAVVRDSPAKIDGIILITPWDTLMSIAKEKFPWLPVSLFLRDKYDTIGNLKEYQGRIAIIGAEQDEVIPIQHAQALFRSLSGIKGVHKMFTITRAGHNDWPEIVDLSWWQGITNFMQVKDL